MLNYCNKSVKNEIINNKYIVKKGDSMKKIVLLALIMLSLLPLKASILESETSANAEEPRLNNVPAVTYFAHGSGESKWRCQEKFAAFAPLNTIPIGDNFENANPSFGPQENINLDEDQPTSVIAYSQGCATMMYYLGSHNGQNIKSIVLVSPPSDPCKVVSDRQFTSLYTPRWVCNHLLPYVFKNYDTSSRPQIESIKTMTVEKTTPIVIVHGQNDKLVPWDHGYDIAKEFLKNGYINTYFVSHQGEHFGPIDETTIAIVQNIYEKHDIPNNAETIVSVDEYLVSNLSPDITQGVSQTINARTIKKAIGTTATAAITGASAYAVKCGLDYLCS